MFSFNGGRITHLCTFFPMKQQHYIRNISKSFSFNLLNKRFYSTRRYLSMNTNIVHHKRLDLNDTDSHFIFPTNINNNDNDDDDDDDNNNNIVFGIFDALGGWENFRSNVECIPEYSKHLCTFLEEESKNIPHIITELENEDSDNKVKKRVEQITGTVESVLHKVPIKLLDNAYNKTINDEINLYGSSTALLVIFSKEDGKFAFVNLGSGGILVVRKGDIFYRTTPQYSSWNQSYHLSTSISGNKVEDAQTGSFTVEKGDIVICGSDGLFDNLYDNHIVDIVHESGRDNKILCEQIAKVAFQWSNDDNKVVPFAEHCAEEGYMFAGGRKDDVTVIVSTII